MANSTQQAMPTPPPQPVSGASTSDIMSVLKNIVIAINNLAQNYLNVQGTLNAANITTPTVVKTTAGRVATVSVLSAGTTVGVIYDASTLMTLTKPLGIIPMEVGLFPVNLATSFGILVVPGTGQVVTVGYS